MSGEEGVMDLDAMSNEELADLVERARHVIAVRQTSAAIARDITGAVDPIVAGSLDILADSWEHGRVSWDGETLTIGALRDYDDVEVPEPAPEEPGIPEWAPNVPVSPGDLLVFEGVTYRVIQAHTTASHWRPDHLPALYQREE